MTFKSSWYAIGIVARSAAVRDHLCADGVRWRAIRVPAGEVVRAVGRVCLRGRRDRRHGL
jgi:hypothetical protein